jgi:tripartite-type tricarboxylate transporter receptor subunit TctC
MGLRTLTSVLAGAAALAIAPAAAQTRTAPLKIILPFAGGGSGDALTRLIAEQLGTRLDRSVIVEPRVGAAGRLGVAAVKAAEPDGNTLLATPIAPMVVYPSVYPSLDYDPVGDFAPVSQMASFEFGIAVGPQVPVKDLAGLVAWLKANPSQANFGTPGAGTLPHFFGMMFARSAGISLQHIAYKGGTLAVTDLMGGQIPIVFLSTNEFAELHRANRIRVLATSNTQRSQFLPEVPTFKENGFDIEGVGWWGMFAPAKTPPATIAKISAAIAETLASEDIREKVRRIGLQPTGTTPDDFARIQRDDITRWAPAVKASGFTPGQ